jgi:hypothetical protein
MSRIIPAMDRADVDLFDGRPADAILRDARWMTTWQSLLYCAAADVTLERIRNLVAVTGTESLTVDFKEGRSTPTIAECAAAMANTHGGLILVGITDQEREIVGVPREAIAHIAMCSPRAWSPLTGSRR